MSGPCPLCFHEAASGLFQSRDRVHGLPGVFTVFQCHRCSAVFYLPRLGDQELASYYPEIYGRYRVSRSLDKRSYRGIRRFILENHYGYPSLKGGDPSQAKKWIALFLSLFMAKDAIPHRGEGKFLDIGCGGGSYLYRLKQWGWNVYGVEPSGTGAAQAQSLGLNVHHGQIQDARFPDSFFDVVRLHHVLEHLTDPRGTFREIKRVLKADGLVYITVPNTRSLNFWLFGENWYGLDIPRHVVSYSPEALKFLCDGTGFEIVMIRFRSGPFNFVRSVKYYLDDKGDRWPRWLREINWPSNKMIRRTLKPFFFFIDRVCFGDVLQATLRKIA